MAGTVLGLVACVAAASDDVADQRAMPDFARDILPIFEQHCFACHGPDMHEAGLRLDVKARALAGGDNGVVIQAGDSSQSRLVARITSDDESVRMPLDAEPLSAEEIERVRRWIDGGAPWPEHGDGGGASQGANHWAFRPPKQVEPPTVEDAAWVRTPIDRFVLARLEGEGLRPSPQADRYTLARRLHLDLTGLPPTPEEADAFVRDRAPDAYERLVDRLLASPAYGERWARLWLDLARYADTNGYEKDRERSMFPYRDWVIRAINEDMPFDQFTIEQIAGDMLPGATSEQQVATGFHRNTMINEEGGIDVEEFRFASMVDRVATTGTVWLGLSIGCAQCHSHKYDPISQREYYEFFALLNNADEPEIGVPDEHLAAQRAEAEARIAELEQKLHEHRPGLEAEGKFAAWRQDAAAKASPWDVVSPSQVESQAGATLTLLDDGSVLASGDKPNRDTYVVQLETPLEQVTAIRLEVLPHESLPEAGPGRAPLFATGDFLLSEVSVAAAPLSAGGELAPVALAGATHSYAPEERSAGAAIDGLLDTGWSIQGRTGQPHHAVFPLVPPLVQPGGSKLVVTLVQHYIHHTTIGRFRLSVTDKPQPVEAASVPADVEAILSAADRVPHQMDADNERLWDYYLSIAPELSEQQAAIAELRKSLPRLPTTLVLQERLPQHRRTTHVHHRGEFLKPTEPVEPEVPAVLHPLPEGAPADRLALARWLVSQNNPLVGRVMMNREWQAFFGRGLVRTSEDFGTRGERPTHPELLDWLAGEFVRRGSSRKQMHRLIVTSATYRQSSHLPPELLARDPHNELLARGPRRRLEAEMIRDQALAAAGLLDRRIGGKSVFPPQPPGVTTLAYGGQEWQTSTGADRYRRGLYTFAKRTAPYAAFTLFDAPSGEICTVRRERSNTPLQALTLLNDTVFVEASQALARRAVEQAPDDPRQRAQHIFRRLLTRPASEAEMGSILAFYERQAARFREGGLDASLVAGPNPPDADLVERAAWTAVARAALNLDATVTRE